MDTVEQLQQALDALQQHCAELERRNQVVEQENADLQILLDTTTEHADLFERQLIEARNTLEVKVAQRTQELAEKNALLHQEIHERRRIEEAQRNNLLFLKTLLDSISSPIFYKNLDGVYLGCNQAFQDCIGFSEDKIVGYTDEQLFSSEVANHFKKMDAQLLATKRNQIYEYALPYRGQTVREMLINKTLFNNTEGNAAGSVAVMVDISDRKQFEAELLKAKDEAEHSNRAKSNFLANMSHELRTPLNAIIGYSEIIQEDMGDLGCEELQPDVKKINAAGKHLLGLINDVLDISKIEAGKMDVYPESFDLHTLVQEVVATVEPLVRDKNNVLNLQCKENLGEIFADLTKTRQILFNILSNAAKFTENGHILFTVEREAIAGRDWVSFIVADEGIGMSSEQLDRLFKPFTQADPSTTRKYGGTGLGLAITKRFTEMMGGSVVVDSALGNGSSFTIRLPASVQSNSHSAVFADEQQSKTSSTISASTNEIDPTKQYQQQIADAQQAQTHSHVILVIDDDPVVRDLLYNYLIKLGYYTVTAENGQQGLTLAEQIQPQAITLDVIMPEMDGWMVLSELKKNTKTLDIPVIILSLVEDKSIGYSLGAAEYLHKPIDRHELGRILNKYLESNTINTHRILLVEDDDETRNALASMLRKHQIKVLLAENGRIALDILVTQAVDLIITDLIMPEVDGFEFINRLKQNEQLNNTPIVVLAPQETSADDRTLLNQSVSYVLEKGAYDLERLFKEIEACLAQIIKANSN